jgi:hypothetical protein
MLNIRFEDTILTGLTSKRGVVHSRKSSYTPPKNPKNLKKIQKNPKNPQISKNHKKIQNTQQFLEEYIEQFIV